MHMMRPEGYPDGMRTTVTIDDELLALAKHTAGERSMTLGQLMEVALRRELSRGDAVSAGVDLPTSRGGGYLPGVELSNRGLYEAADEIGDAQ